jgi:NADPH-dependent curcumin reductase CurA
MQLPKKNKQFILKSRPKGIPCRDNYELTESVVKPLEEGSFLMKNDFISLDPAIRGWMSESEESYMPPIKLGDPIRSSTLSTVIASKNPDYDVGDLVLGLNAWEEYTCLNTVRHIHSFATKMPKNLGIPHECLISVLGATGMTAYFGLLELGQPKSGDTLVISSAAGAVGSIVGQIGKIKGCKVIGIAGSDEKCKVLKDEYGFDEAINYKTFSNRDSLSKRLNEVCPDGIDIYFENVGGYILESVLDNIAEKARIVICGMIAQYNSSQELPGPSNLWQLVVKSATMKGFLIRDYVERMDSAAIELGTWLSEGKIKNKVHIEYGFENIPEVFLKLFDGTNNGKLMVKL